MVIEISHHWQSDKYLWTLYDGPDGIDKRVGQCDTLGEVFEKVVEARLIIAKSYK